MHRSRDWPRLIEVVLKCTIVGWYIALSMHAPLKKCIVTLTDSTAVQSEYKVSLSNKYKGCSC